jgi:hypothetical protein
MSQKPNYPGAPERIRRQFAGTTPAGRVFLVVVYSAALAGLIWATLYIKPLLADQTLRTGAWLRETFGYTLGTTVDIALILVPLALLWYFAFWRQRD